MLKYEELLNSLEIIDIYNKIDKTNNYYKNHGTKHMKNVVKISNKLIDLFNIDENEKNNILIAAILHDIGRVVDDETHAYQSKIMAEKIIHNKVEINDEKYILKMIENHGRDKIDKRNTIGEEILFLADKMDMSRERLEDDYQLKYNIKSGLEYIQSIDFRKQENILIVIANSNNTITLQEFEKIEPKFILELNSICKDFTYKMNLQYKIYFDNQIIENVKE